MAEKDANELSPEEAQALAVERSNASKKDFDPSKDGFASGDKVVELPNRESVVVSDLVDHDDPVIAADAQAVVDENYPGGANYPNGPGEASARKSAPRKETSAGTSGKADENK